METGQGVWRQDRVCGDSGDRAGCVETAGYGDRVCGDRAWCVETEQGMETGCVETVETEQGVETGQGVWRQGRVCGDRAGCVETVETGQGVWRQGRVCGDRTGCVETGQGSSERDVVVCAGLDNVCLHDEETTTGLHICVDKRRRLLLFLLPVVRRQYGK